MFPEDNVRAVNGVVFFFGFWLNVECNLKFRVLTLLG